MCPLIDVHMCVCLLCLYITERICGLMIRSASAVLFAHYLHTFIILLHYLPLWLPAKYLPYFFLTFFVFSVIVSVICRPGNTHTVVSLSCPTVLPVVHCWVSVDPLCSFHIWSDRSVCDSLRVSTDDKHVTYFSAYFVSFCLHHQLFVSSVQLCFCNSLSLTLALWSRTSNIVSAKLPALSYLGVSLSTVLTYPETIW